MDKAPLLQTALAHHSNRIPVLAVNSKKRPCTDEWNRWFEQPQTEAEVRAQFSNGAYGLALLAYPGSPYAVLNFDGVHADEAWHRTGIALPETAMNRTRGGGVHLIYRVSGELAIPRKVRLVKAACDCRDSEKLDAAGQPKKKTCGVDLLVNGYFVVPPTPGYHEDPDHPFDHVAPLPSEVLTLVKAERERAKKK